jgi:hypothetical protein
MEKQIDWAAMERWSGTVFGNVHRLPVAVAALELDPDGIYPEAIKKRLDLPSSTRAKEQLERFVSAGLLKPPRDERPLNNLHRGRGRPPKIYPRRDDEFWDYLKELVDRRFRR